MRPGEIQDANSSNEHQCQVDTDPEDPVLGKRKRPAPARLTRANADKLRRVLGKVEPLRPQLFDAIKLITAPDSPFTSAAFVMSLGDSIKALDNDAKDINQLLEHKDDDGTSLVLRDRVQDHLSAADLKLKFVSGLKTSHSCHNWFLDEILGKDADDVQFMIRVR